MDEKMNLLQLCHELGNEARGLVVANEGNASAKINTTSFWVNAGRPYLAQLQQDDLVECLFDKTLPLLNRTSLDEAQVEICLAEARVDSAAKQPSAETLLHAYLLMLPGVTFVAHTHPVTVNQILCSARAKEFADNRCFPEEIIYCGAVSLFIPYKDPGLPLAQSIRRYCEGHMQKYGVPRAILLENHGLIALGHSAEAVLATTLMMEKAARIWMGAASLGGPKYLHIDHIRRIHDKHKQ